MPRRKTPFAIGETYHVFNRSVGDIPIFNNSDEYHRMINLIDYYRFEKPTIRFSHYNRLQKEAKNLFIMEHNKGKSIIKIFSFCLMPNHFHFLMKQRIENGIPLFAKNIQNAYARYFNTKHERSGALFQHMFKKVRIENDNQFKHVMRYIHLNPLTSYLLKDPEELGRFQWGSFGSYTKHTAYDFVDTEFTLKMFSNKRDRLIKFVLNQADYQRKLANIKHLVSK